MRFEIAGALATGKTTLARMLEDEGFVYVRENLENNPYLELRKIDPETYDLLCQQRFVEDKIGAIAAASGDCVADYCLAVEKAYVSFYLGYRPDWQRQLLDQIDDGYASLGAPEAVIYLRASPETQLERIRNRGRGFEQGHDLEFISTINRLVHERVDEAHRKGFDIIEIVVDAPGAEEAMASLPGRLRRIAEARTSRTAA